MPFVIQWGRAVLQDLDCLPNIKIPLTHPILRCGNCLCPFSLANLWYCQGYSTVYPICGTGISEIQKIVFCTSPSKYHWLYAFVRKYLNTFKCVTKPKGVKCKVSVEFQKCVTTYHPGKFHQNLFLSWLQHFSFICPTSGNVRIRMLFFLLSLFRLIVLTSKGLSDCNVWQNAAT